MSAGTLVALLVIHGRPTFSILPRTQTEVTSPFISCYNERRNSTFRKTPQRILRSDILRIKIDLKPHMTPFAFGFLTNDGRHILTLKNKATSLERGMFVGVILVSQVSSAKLHHVFTSQQLSVVLAAIIMTQTRPLSNILSRH